jgi:hypothetical protein
LNGKPDEASQTTTDNRQHRTATPTAPRRSLTYLYHTDPRCPARALARRRALQGAPETTHTPTHLPRPPRRAMPSSPPARPRRLTTTSAEDIDAAIIHPGSVRINVEGAFIVDSDATSPDGGGSGGGPATPSHETSDIRLPNHTAVVSHIAIDAHPFGGCRLAALSRSWSTLRTRKTRRPSPAAASRSSTLRRTGSTTASSL